MDILLKNGLCHYRGEFRRLDLLIRGGVIADINPKAPLRGCRSIDLQDKYILPGLADVHVHLREPGFSYKETIATGTAAAAKGGFTTVCAMPNVVPPPDNYHELRRQIEYSRQHALIDVRHFGCITQGGTGEGELLNYSEMSKLAVGFSDDGNGVQSRGKMREAMSAVAECGSIIAAHCEDKVLTAGGVIHKGEYARTHSLPGVSSESEWKQIKRDIELALKAGCNYHVCHISTAEGVELIREAKAEGLPVSCETAPHYLVFCDGDLMDEGRFKMSPPLRSERDRDALRQGLLDGTIDMIATDHAPHSMEEKSKGLLGSTNGVVGLETSLSVIYTEFVRSGLMSMNDLVRIMSTAPRERFNLGGGVIDAGLPADLILFDPGYSYIADPGEFLSLGKATPFEGKKLQG